MYGCCIGVQLMPGRPLITKRIAWSGITHPPILVRCDLHEFEVVVIIFLVRSSVRNLRICKVYVYSGCVSCLAWWSPRGLTSRGVDPVRLASRGPGRLPLYGGGGSRHWACARTAQRQQPRYIQTTDFFEVRSPSIEAFAWQHEPPRSRLRHPAPGLSGAVGRHLRLLLRGLPQRLRARRRCRTTEAALLDPRGRGRGRPSPRRAGATRHHPGRSRGCVQTSRRRSSAPEEHSGRPDPHGKDRESVASPGRREAAERSGEKRRERTNPHCPPL